MAGLAIHGPARPAGAAAREVHGRLAQGAGRVVGAERPAHGEGHIAAFLAERHPAELGRVRRPGGGWFARYRLRISGLVETPREFSLADLKAMPKQEQITTHFCIQGWSGVAKWGGVPMRHILDLVRPTAEARYAVFYSLADGPTAARYYDVHELHNMRHPLTLLAYEMNGAPLSVLHGAPLRLRCENELGFKMVKWIEAIEFVATSPISAPARAATTRTTNSTATGCRFEHRQAPVCEARSGTTGTGDKSIRRRAS